MATAIRRMVQKPRRISRPRPTFEAKSPPGSDAESQAKVEVHYTHTHESSPLAQIVAVIILEFGVIFHSVIIGLTLAVDPAFKVLFIVILFHQMFEGLGLGTRLAALKLPPSYRWTPLVGAIVYGLTTPIGLPLDWVSAPPTTPIRPLH
jgi:zinc transporter 1/2/3